MKEKNKINWLEKKVLRKMFRKVKTDLEKRKEEIRKRKEEKEEQKLKEHNDKKEEKLKEEIIKSIVEMQDVFTLEEDDGSPITKDTLRTKTTDELIKLLEDIIKGTEELLR